MEIKKSVKDLKKGDTVLFYGQEFEVTKDSRELLPNRPGVYFADCVIKNKEALKGKIDSVLWRYDGFQGIESVMHIVII